MIENQLEKVHASLSALSVGPGYPWSQNYLIALGWTARYDKLADKIVHLLAYPSKNTYSDAIQALQSNLSKQVIGRDGKAKNIAEKGLKYWLFGHCVACSGAGCNFEQVMCPECQGTGWAKSDEEQRTVKRMIEWSLEHKEGLLKSSLRYSYKEPTLASPKMGSLIPECGCYSLPHNNHN